MLQPLSPAHHRGFLWLAGSGVALIIGLLMFGRRLRREPDPAPLVAAPLAVSGERRRQSDGVIKVEESSAHDFGLNDDTTNVPGPRRHSKRRR